PGDPPGRFWFDPAGIFRGDIRRSARNRGCGQRLFRTADIELPVRGAFARHGEHAARAANRGRPAAETFGAGARARAELLREFPGARRALPVSAGRAAIVPRTEPGDIR